MLFAVTTIVACFSMRAGWLFSGASIGIFMALILFLVGTNLPFLAEGVAVLPAIFSGKAHPTYLGVWRCSLVIFWAFIGWEELSFGLEEFKNPKRNIPLVYWISFVVVSVFYVALGFTSIGASIKGVSISGASGLAGLAHKDTNLGKWIVFIMVLLATANINANVYSFSRLFFAAARDGLLPRVLSRLSKRGLPVASLILCFVLYAVVTEVVEQYDFNITSLVAIVDQAFLLLYVFTIIAYWKVEQGHRRYWATGTAALSCVLFLSAADIWVLYPLGLVLSAYLRHLTRGKERRTALDRELAALINDNKARSVGQETISKPSL